MDLPPPKTHYEDEVTGTLSEALDGYDHSGAKRILDEVGPRLKDLADPAALLRVLNEHGCFRECVRLGRIEFDHRPHYGVALPYAQALIEVGRHTRGIEVLRQWEPRWRETKRDVNAALGRAYKQLYIDASPNASECRSQDLDRALEHYTSSFEGRLDHPLWNGDHAPLYEAINVVALLHHAHQRDPTRNRREDLARKVYREALRRLDHAEDPWIAATALEAGWATHAPLDRLTDFLERYISHDAVTIFALQSTLRQLRQLWQIDSENPEGEEILRMLHEACIIRGGQGLSLTRRGTERVWGHDSYLDLRVLDEIRKRADGVGRVELRTIYDAVPVGTAFLITPDLALTCRHVVAEYSAERYQISFTTHCGGDGITRGVSEIVWRGEAHHDDHLDLDVALLRLEKPVKRLERVIDLEQRTHCAPAGRAYLIGYPQGLARAQISLHDSRLVAYNEYVLQYRTPSNPGSSGSPVHDDQWRIVGLHCMGYDKLRHAQNSRPLAANQAIRFDRILAELRRKSLLASGEPTIELRQRHPSHVGSTPEALCRARAVPKPRPRPDSSSRGPRRDAVWWFADHGEPPMPGFSLLGDESAHPLVIENQQHFYFRVVTGAEVELEYHGGDEQWESTNTYGNVFVNRVKLGLFGDLLLEISGQDHLGRDITVGGWYYMDGVYHDFGPGQPGQTIFVVIDNTVSLEDPLQIFSFQVEGVTNEGDPYAYDPVVLLAPAKGELTLTG